MWGLGLWWREGDIDVGGGGGDGKKNMAVVGVGMGREVEKAKRWVREEGSQRIIKR